MKWRESYKGVEALVEWDHTRAMRYPADYDLAEGARKCSQRKAQRTMLKIIGMANGSL
jgi:hypothetical protein